MKILLADDSMTAQNMGKKILTDAGYEVVAVSNGAAAVKKIAEQRPDVAVLDVYMPGYTGLEVCERLKTAHDTTHMPVLLTVGRMEPFKPEEGSRVKADGIIIKPFEASDLLAAIQKIERRLSPARPVEVASAAPSSDPTSIFEKTQKISIPYGSEFKDASYEEWKVSAPGHAEEGQPHATVQGVPAFGVPEDMQATPAFGMDELEVVPAAEPDPQRVTQILDTKPAPPPPPPAPPVMTPPAAAPRTTAQIEHKTEAMPAVAGAAAQPEPTKSISGVWRALDKARDWFGGSPDNASPERPDDSAVAHISDLPEEKLAEAFSAPPMQDEKAANTPAFEPVPVELVAEVPPVADGPRTLHELAYETMQSYGAVAESAAPAGQTNDLEHTSASPVEVTHVRDPHLELSPKVSLEGAEVTVNPDLEPTIRSSEAAPTIIAADPSLVTDPSDLVSSFPTRFGVANPEDVPVGVASNFPHLYADAHQPSASDPVEEEVEVIEPAVELKPAQKLAPASPSHLVGKSAWVAEEAPLDDHESGLKLHDEMHQAFAGASTTEDEAAEIELVEPEAEATEDNSNIGTAADPELAAAMAAAVGAQMAPSMAQAVSESATPESVPDDDKTAIVADIVQRVVDMMKPELIRRISSELSKKK